jgi:hypothetical protein
MKSARKYFYGYISGLALLFAVVGVMPAVAQDSGGLPAKTYVAVRSKADPAPAVAQTSVQLKENGKLAQVT